MLAITINDRVSLRELPDDIKKKSFFLLYVLERQFGIDARHCPCPTLVYHSMLPK